MQLDNTRIAVRERNIVDVLDLSLHVTRSFIRPLLVTLGIGVVPMLILNHLLIGWMAEVPFGEELSDRDYWSLSRYVAAMIALVAIEAPLATDLMSAYLGKVVFLEKPSLTQLCREFVRMLPQVILCQVFLRGIAVAWFIAGIIRRYGDFSPFEFLLYTLAFLVVIVRGFRPFLAEIILLEKNPFFASKGSDTMTISRRAGLLHNPNSGDLASRSIVCTIMASCLGISTFGTCLFFSGVLFAQWAPGLWMVQLFFPLSLWLVAGFMTVVRFLNYLDLRIRQEGWEVELLLKAEAIRMAGKFA